MRRATPRQSHLESTLLVHGEAESLRYRLFVLVSALARGSSALATRPSDYTMLLAPPSSCPVRRDVDLRWVRKMAGDEADEAGAGAQLTQDSRG